MPYHKPRVWEPEIVPYADRVVICRQEVRRPAGISPSQWLKFWEEVYAAHVQPQD